MQYPLCSTLGRSVLGHFFEHLAILAFGLVLYTLERNTLFEFCEYTTQMQLVHLLNKCTIKSTELYSITKIVKSADRTNDPRILGN